MTNPLTDLMRQRVVVLEQLLIVSEKQLKLVESGAVTTLLKLLARKQGMLDKLEALERALDPFRGTRPEDRSWDSEEERAVCSHAVGRCEQLLAAIMELDTMSERELSRQKDQTQARLQRSGSCGNAASAYAKQNLAPPVPPRQNTMLRFDFKESQDAKRGK